MAPRRAASDAWHLPETNNLLLVWMRLAVLGMAGGREMVRGFLNQPQTQNPGETTATATVPLGRLLISPAPHGLAALSQPAQACCCWCDYLRIIPNEGMPPCPSDIHQPSTRWASPRMAVRTGPGCQAPCAVLALITIYLSTAVVNWLPAYIGGHQQGAGSRRLINLRIKQHLHPQNPWGQPQQRVARPPSPEPTLREAASPLRGRGAHA